MQIPEQAKPVARVAAPARPATDSHVRPQICWCLDPDQDGTSHWFCEAGRELFNTNYECLVPE
jgi:hypothetical protein